MSMYLDKQRQHATAQITATHGTVLKLIRRVEGLGHKIYMDNYFTWPALFDDLFQRNINACGTVRHDVGLSIFPCCKLWHTKVNLFH
jgi:hypothetical protein